MMDRRLNSDELKDDDQSYMTKSSTVGEVQVEGSKFFGYASVFNGRDSYGDSILPGAFTETLAKYETPKMFFNHNQSEVPIGKWTLVKEDDKGLYVEGEFTEGNAHADEVKAALKHGTINGLSIGFWLSPLDCKFDPDTDTRYIHKIKRLQEVSLVTWPADGNARITGVKMEDIDAIDTPRDIEKVLRDSGLSRKQAQAFCARAKDVFTTLRDSEDEITPDIKSRVEEVVSRLENLIKE